MGKRSASHALIEPKWVLFRYGGMGKWGYFSVVCQGTVVRVVPVGRRSKVGGIIVPVSFWEVSVFCPNFLVFNLHSALQNVISSASSQ